MGEDRTRLRNAKALINLALLRSVNLWLLGSTGAEDWLPAQKERLAASPTAALSLVKAEL